MPFLRIDVDVAGADVTAIEEACFSLGACAVTLVDQRDDPVLEPAPGEIRLWPATALQSLFAADAAGQLPDSSRLLASLQASTGLEAARFGARRIEDRVWEREWLRDFKPMRFGSRLWIVPGEHDSPPEARAVVRLDPGLAFGTGTHPTTAMCLGWLDAELTPDTAVLDYGCGSGVLAIAALTLGARSAQAFDIDPQALLATDENASRNQVRDRLTIASDARGLHAADVVLANILAGPLMELAPRLIELMRPGGRLVLAGLLDEQTPEVIAAYAPRLTLGVAQRRDGWALLTGQRRSNSAQFPL